MIINSKQQQLTFEKGITNVPSDAICSDNALAESVGLIYVDGEHRVIQEPKTMYESDQGEWEQSFLVYIHRFGVKERWLFANKKRQGVYLIDWYYPDANGSKLVLGGTLKEEKVQKEFSFTEEELRNHNFKITATGKSLVVLDQKGISYFVWKDSSYSEAVKVPQPKFEFELYPGTYSSEEDVYGLAVQADGKPNGIISDVVEDQEKYNNLVIGLYSKNLNTIGSANAFCQPFLVRVALQLYDDTYTYISQPVMMFGCVTENSRFLRYSDHVGLMTYCYYLYGKQTTDYTDLSDIVKNVSIFVSDGIDPHDLTTDQPFRGWGLTSGKTSICNAVYSRSSLPGQNESKNAYIETEWSSRDDAAHTFMRTKSRDAIKAELESSSVFYKLCDIGIKPISSLKNLKSYIKPHTVNNITTQEILPNDDYFSRCSLKATIGYAYNSRLNIANVHRGFFEGYGYFLPFQEKRDSTQIPQKADEGSCDFYVTIATSDGDFTVKHTEYTYDYQGIYFYYPDSRAKHVVVVKNGHICLDADLTEHPGLNGAYYFKGLPGFEGKQDHVSGDIPKSYDNDATEYLPNHILTSEVDNPYVFKAEGYNSVGVGRVIGMSTITQALSQGQFGQYPLLVFSESGIWAMSVSGTGQFASIHPMSREVCNNVASITQTDGAVFFSSEKGLMVVVGGDVKCVSEQLSGRELTFDGIIQLGNFIDYLRTAFVAYDYRDSLLWIFKPAQKTCYIYSIKSGTFGKYTFEEYIDMAVNYYPDFILQEGGNIYSLLTRPNINLDENTYSGYIITRPMKFENGLALKTISEIVHVRDFKQYTVQEATAAPDSKEEATTKKVTKGSLKLRVFASNNFDAWVERTSLLGTPWKYYRFRYDFSGLKATDRFAGSVIVTQERRTNKLR